MTRRVPVWFERLHLADIEVAADGALSLRYAPIQMKEDQMKLLTMAFVAAVSAGAAQADGTHMPDHDAAPGGTGQMEHMGDMDHMGGTGAASGHGVMAIGAPARAEEAARTVTVAMRETEDGRMVFDPPVLDFAAGETVRLAIRNEGEQEHEFVMDAPDEIQEHKAMMAEMPDMVHRDVNALRLGPGESGEIVWTFGAPGRYEFACLIPGHYEGGMHGPLVVR
ncbi:cupredoxin domain-containing protein [Cereibacter azotoformans]|uniref:Putative cupredoxin-like copper-binding protein n=1 Tax=Cereibacter azotoformans TaxID=43057 RepID=A0A2T5JTC0_9RHOB|nr:plastocyanin/azurin family copper-binding protein [Cereibacter azotoformans]PTR13414.1 putative cupredoxin-like copper-binding protein [Cereibacter azotoformans]